MRGSASSARYADSVSAQSTARLAEVASESIFNVPRFVEALRDQCFDSILAGRLLGAHLYEGIVDTIVQLFCSFISGLIAIAGRAFHLAHFLVAGEIDYV